VIALVRKTHYVGKSPASIALGPKGGSLCVRECRILLAGHYAGDDQSAARVTGALV
jgi:hypothetical protein